MGLYAQEKLKERYWQNFRKKVKLKKSGERLKEKEKIGQILKDLPELLKTSPEEVKSFSLYLVLFFPSSIKEVRISLAECYYLKAEYDSSLFAFQSLIALYPESKSSPYFHLRLGESLEKKGKIEEALKTYWEGIEKFPEEKESALCLEKGFSLSYQNKDYKQAKRFCDKLFRLFPDYTLKEGALKKFHQKIEEESQEEKKELIAKIAFSYYPEKKVPLLREVLKKEKIASYLELIDRNPNSVTSLPALEKVIAAYPEDGFSSLIYLLTYLKYSKEKVGLYAKKQFLFSYSKTSLLPI